MKLILCADDHWGLAFHGRRQSRDTLQRAHMLRLVGPDTLRMSPYSAALFTGTAAKPLVLPENILVRERPEEAAGHDYVFSERTELMPYLAEIEVLYVYHWNRSYPTSLRVPEALRTRLIPVRTEAFRGSSHDHILFEEYCL